jgi:RimJ/RimL family protein N-acetyltransferase
MGRRSKLDCDLETERFHLRRCGRLQAFFWTRGWRRDPELLEGLFQSPRSYTLLQWWFRGPRPNGRTRFAHAIVSKASGEVIGLHVVVRRRDGSVAYCHVAIHDRAWWGQGVVVEVRARMLSHFFAHGTERFVATIDARNAPSIFNYRRLGFRAIGNSTTHNPDPATGRGRPAVEMELRRKDWVAPGEDHHEL